MKKILLFAVLAAFKLTAQTPIYQFNFDENATEINGAGEFSLYATTNYVQDRFNNPSSAITKTGASTFYPIDLPLLPQGSAARSVSVWVKFENVPDFSLNNPPVMGIFFYGTTSPGQGFGLQQRYDKLDAYSYGVDFYSETTPLNSFVPGGWYHYVVTFDGTTVKTYRNGRLLIEEDASVWNTNGTNFKLGTHNAGLATNTKLTYDDLKIYDVALDEYQIKNMYVAESPLNTTDLLSFFDFENTLNSYDNAHSFGTIPSVPSGAYNGGLNDSGLGLTVLGGFINTTIAPFMNDDNFTIAFWQKRDVAVTNLYETSIELFNSLYLRQQIYDGEDNYDACGLYYDLSNNMSSEEVMYYTPIGWNHYAMVYTIENGNRVLKYYINGDYVRTVTLPTGQTLDKVSNDIYLGTGYDGTATGAIPMSQKFAAITLDNLYFFNRALQQHEIIGMKYQQPAAPLSNAVFESTSIQLYPNPASQLFRVESSNEIIKQVTVLDITGKVLITTTDTEVNISSLAKGVLLVKIETSSGKIETKRLIVK